jgi:hypothetical protein
MGWCSRPYYSPDLAHRHGRACWRRRSHHLRSFPAGAAATAEAPESPEALAALEVGRRRSIARSSAAQPGQQRVLSTGRIR